MNSCTRGKGLLYVGHAPAAISGVSEYLVEHGLMEPILPLWVNLVRVDIASYHVFADADWSISIRNTRPIRTENTVISLSASVSLARRSHPCHSEFSFNTDPCGYNANLVPKVNSRFFI